MSEKLVLHEDPRSGNCYKIRLTAALLALPLERRQYDIMKGETRTPDFLARVNSNGRIPVLQIGERFLPESNAACFYLGDGTRLVPQDRFNRADMLRWMFFEQYNHEPNIATLRFWFYFVGETNLSEEQLGLVTSKRMAGEAALELMDRHLAVCRRCHFARRYRALCLHPCRRDGRLRPVRPCPSVRLARPGRRPARLCTHGLGPAGG